MYLQNLNNQEQVLIWEKRNGERYSDLLLTQRQYKGNGGTHSHLDAPR
jgi:hypothetical protein